MITCGVLSWMDSGGQTETSVFDLNTALSSQHKPDIKTSFSSSLPPSFSCFVQRQNIVGDLADFHPAQAKDDQMAHLDNASILHWTLFYPALEDTSCCNRIL